MTPRARVVLAATAVASVGCGSVKRDFENICHSEERSGISAADPPADRAHKQAKWIAEHITTQEAKAIFAKLAELPPEEKGPALRDAAAKAGVSPCPMADFK